MIFSTTKEAWHTKAACRGENLVSFFAPPFQSERREMRARRERLAKSICSSCPVRQECLEYALSIPEPHGIWGGMNESERRRLVQRSAI